MWGSLRKGKIIRHQIMVGRQRCVITHKIQEERYDKYRKCEIYVIVGNGQKMNCELKGSVL